MMAPPVLNGERAGRFEDGGQVIDHVVKLSPDAAGGTDAARPRYRHSLPSAAEV
jgi:hypothetical protein